MTTLAQFILLVVIVTLTFLIAFVAMQVFHILHELRQVLKKIHTMTDQSQAQVVLSELKNMVRDSEHAIVQKTAQNLQSQVEKKNLFKRAGSPLRPS